MGKTLYTIGYGMLKGPHETRKQSFQKRLVCLRQDIGKPITVVDIRKKDCGSINGTWCSWDGLRATVRELWPEEKHSSFFQYPYLANKFGGTKAGLENYRSDLWRRYHKKGEIDSIQLLLFDMNTWKDRAYVLLCGCKDAYKYNSEAYRCIGRVNCHRVYVAEAIVAILGEGWTVCHL